MADDNIENLSFPEVDAILNGDIDRILPTPVREAFLDLILAWANLDMAVGFLASAVKGLNPDEGAEKFGRREIADKLSVIAKSLKNNRPDLAMRIDAIKAIYPEKALLRRRIAHSRCAGVRHSDSYRIIFLPFAREGPPGNLAVEIYHVSAFREATEWAEKMTEIFMSIVDKSGFFGG